MALVLYPHQSSLNKEMLGLRVILVGSKRIAHNFINTKELTLDMLCDS